MARLSRGLIIGLLSMAIALSHPSRLSAQSASPLPTSKPPVLPWFVPAIALAIASAGVGVFFYRRSRRSTPAQVLDRHRAEFLLDSPLVSDSTLLDSDPHSDPDSPPDADSDADPDAPPETAASAEVPPEPPQSVVEPLPESLGEPSFERTEKQPDEASPAAELERLFQQASAAPPADSVLPTPAPPMSDETSRDSYATLIEEIVTATLKGQIRSKEIVYQRLTQEIEPGTGEIFDRCLSQRLNLTQAQANDSSDELRQAKATRSLRALQTLQGEWERYQKDQQRTDDVASAAQAILAAEQRFLTWVNLSDPNQPHSLTLEHLEQLTTDLNRLTTASPSPDPEIQQLTAGIKKGMASWRSLEGHLIEWMYEPVSTMGVAATPQRRGPWSLWATHSQSTLLRQLFQSLAQNQPVGELARRQSFSLSEWVELSVTLQLVQRGLVNWFAKQPYGSKWGVQASIATYLTFAAIWSDLARGLEGIGDQVAQGCFQILTQTLRAFAHQSYFPLYGGVFALLSNSRLQDMLEYLDQPLQRVEGTQEKARILTLLGYSQRAVGQFDRAIAFHEQALEIARSEQDQACEVANLNHLSRTFAARKQYAEAIRFSQQALVLARQLGIRVGEAHALTNYGYSEVQSAHQLERMEPEVYEMAIGFLQQGLSLSEKLEDRQCLALCNYSLGVAHVLMEQYQPAVGYLTAGLKSAQESGDLYLQGLNLAYVAEAFYRLGDRAQAIYTACLGMYQLEQINATEWRQPAGLLQILQGQLGALELQQAIAQHRSAIIAQIGVDGYDHILQLLKTN